MKNDITPYKGLQLRFMRDIEPRRLELAEHMGILTKIEVKELTDTNTCVTEPTDDRGFKSCCLQGICTHLEGDE